jgi:hypothetical protein
MIYQSFAPNRHRDRSHWSASPNLIDDYPAAFPQLQLIYPRVHGFRASQITSEQQSDHCRVSPVTYNNKSEYRMSLKHSFRNRNLDTLGFRVAFLDAI